MLTIPFKQTDPVHFQAPISQHIRDVYQLNPDQYAQDIQLLDGLRQDAANPEPSESSLIRMQQYYGQLIFVSGKLSMNDTAIKIPWRWYSAFDGKPKSRPSSSFSVEFEKAHVLFNIGALYNQMGLASMAKNGAESVKQASGYFRSATGIFREITQHYAGELQRSPNPEMLASNLNSLATLNLALAQECFHIKVISEGKIKDGTIAKIASRVAELYSQSYSEIDQGSKIFKQDWLIALQAKAAYFNAIAHYRKSKECNQTGKYGEEVARLKAAETFLKTALDFQKALPDTFASQLKATAEEVKAELKRAEKDNDVIYLDAVPQMNALAAIEKVNLAEATPAPDLEALKPIVGDPLFGKLYPYMVYQQVQAYTERKNNVVKGVGDRIDSANKEATRVLELAGLPGSIQAFEQPIGLPPGVWEKSLEVRSQGGARSLSEQLYSISVMAQDAWNLATEIEHVLDQELKEDQEGRDQFRDRWKRLDSQTAQKDLRAQLVKRRDLLQVARKSDDLVKTKFEKNLPYVEALSATKEELEASIPASVQSSSSQNEPSVVELKKLLSDLSANKTQRAKLNDQACALGKNDDIGPALLEAFSKKTTNYDPVFTKQLSRYDTVQSQLEANITQQSTLLKNIQAANERFKQATRASETLKQREQALQNLEAGYNAFKDLTDNMRQGVKFYTDIATVLQRLHEQCSDYASARAIEKKDILKELVHEFTTAPSLPPRPGQQDSMSYLNYASTVPASSQNPYQQSATAYPPPSSVYGTGAQINMPMPQQMWQPGMPINYSASSTNQGTGPGQPGTGAAPAYQPPSYYPNNPYRPA